MIKTYFLFLDYPTTAKAPKRIASDAERPGQGRQSRDELWYSWNDLQAWRRHDHCGNCRQGQDSNGSRTSFPRCTES